MEHGNGSRELKNKIDELVEIYNNDGKINHVKYPKLLISSLKELYKIIGNDQIKGEIATAVSLFLLQKDRIAKGFLKETDDNAMVNTLIYGPPGVGKTMIAMSIAKILYSLGCLKNNKQEGVKGMLKKHLKENIEGDGGGALAYYFVMLITVLAAVGGSMMNMVKKMGLKLAIGAFILLAILFLAFIYFVPGLLEDEVSQDVEDTQRLSKLYKDEEYFDEKSMFKVLSREDFVGKYQGFTEEKTNNILQNNIGKVIFIDEAYNLTHGPHDTYGIVLLTQINLFMSQHPGEIIFIFAGYEEDIANNIFAIQPGLSRRFMYRFNCTGYNGKELYNIFEYQANKKGWRLSEKDKIEKFILENAKSLKNFGGDTERLLFFCEKEFAKNLKHNIDDTINSKILTKAFKAFSENTFKSEGVKNDGIEFLGKLKSMLG